MPTDSNTTHPTNAALADMLVDDADSIINVAAHDMEGRIRLAAERLRTAGDCEPTPAVVHLITELRKAAAETSDSGTADTLRGLLGEFA
jgi:hypothetical protein